MRPESTHVLFCDDDMLPREHALCDLLKHKVPVVSGFCTTRQEPIAIAAKGYDAASDQFLPLSTVKLNSLVTGPFAVGTAFLLVDRRTVDEAIEHYLSAADWLSENRKLFDRLHVRKENRENERKRIEGIRRAFYATEKYIRLFDYPVGENQFQFGEDIAFGRKLMDLNIPVAIDTNTIVGHIGEYPYSVWDVIERENK